MLLHADPSLAEVPGFTKEQLDALARSVELRRRQLEADIRDYITAKQDELRRHGHELVDRYRAMACDQQPASAKQGCASAAQGPAAPLAPEPEERIKQKKHTRVHKREKELYGLVTPVFLPLLDARDSSPEKEKKPKSRPEAAHSPTALASTAQAGAARDAEQRKDVRKSSMDTKDMAGTALREPVKEQQSADMAKRTPLNKSALRHKDTPRSRRKRVSLVIDGQTVLPADTVDEPPLTSPSSVTTSASNSTASLDDMIDPRLTTPEPPVHLEHRDAVHHSLPLPMTDAIKSASKSLAEAPSSISIAAENSPPLASPRSPSIHFGSAQTATRTLVDPLPALSQQTMHSIPETAGPDPIYSTAPATSAELDLDDLADDDDNTNFDTYVGGLHGSGVDDVDQAGSYGYPSSLGASYMESYMQNRPLSVRMQAANKAGLDQEEKRKLLEEKDEDEEADDVDDDDDDDDGDDARNGASAKHKTVADAADDNFMGDMEDF